MKAELALVLLKAVLLEISVDSLSRRARNVAGRWKLAPSSLRGMRSGNGPV